VGPIAAYPRFQSSNDLLTGRKPTNALFLASGDIETKFSSARSSTLLKIEVIGHSHCTEIMGTLSKRKVFSICVTISASIGVPANIVWARPKGVRVLSLSVLVDLEEHIESSAISVESRKSPSSLVLSLHHGASHKQSSPTSASAHTSIACLKCLSQPTPQLPSPSQFCIPPIRLSYLKNQAQAAEHHLWTLC
jgi:hypothetical protein